MADVKYPNGTTGDSKSYTVTNNSSEYSTARNLYYEQSDRDYVAVVRCKDCKWYEESIYPELRPTRFCYRLKNNKGVHIGYNWDGNDFCSYGERREDANS